MSSAKRIRFYRRLDVKLTVWYTITFLSMIVALLFFLDYRIRHNLLGEIDRDLADETHEIISYVLRASDETDDRLREFEKSISQRRYYPLEFRLLDHEGRQIYLSSTFKKDGFAIPLPGRIDARSPAEEYSFEFFRLPGKSYPFRLCTHYYRNGAGVGHVVQVAMYLMRMDKRIENFRRNLVVSFLLALVSGSVGGWFLSRKSLEPIHKITAETSRINAMRLHQRLALRGSGDELDRLAAIINEMLGRLDTAFIQLTQFTADAAHELRTPIAALKGETEVCLSKERSSEEYREVLVNNLERIDFLTKLVNDLLLLAQMDEQGKPRALKPLDLGGLIEPIWQAFSLVAAQKEIEFLIDRKAEAVISGDDIRLKRLFSNLIDNALKYTPEGGRIVLTIQHENGRAVVSIEDTGVGISEEELPCLFDRFYRADRSRSRDSGGVGLGLSISKRIVKAHKGTITVESRRGRGTTFTVRFPAITTYPPPCRDS